MGGGAERDFDTAAADVDDDRGASADVHAVAGGQMDEPGFFGARDDCESGYRFVAPTSAIKSPPLSASRVALVAEATISSTLWDSASRLNFASVCSAADMADWVRLRPSSPPAPSRTISFSLSITSNDRSGPHLHHDHVDGVGADVDGGYAHAEAGSSAGPSCLLHGGYILANYKSPAQERPDRSPSYHEHSCSPCTTALLLERLARALKRHLPAAIAGDDTAVHQARVASRRLREAVPVLADRA